MAKKKTFFSPDQGPLNEHMLASRVDLARMVSYRNFFEVKSKDDFYFEDLLNNFIALVQQPLSFAIYKKVHQGGRVLCFHFCSDKEHRKWFEEELLNKPPKSRGKNREQFELFPELLDHKYFITIFLMHTKILRNGKKTSRIKRISKDVRPDNRKEYISICAKRFFEDPWDGFHSLFNEAASDAIKSSIERIEINNIPINNTNKAGATFPVTQSKISDARKSIVRPNKDREDWHGKLRGIFTRAISTFEFGNQSISQLMHVDEEFIDSQGPFPQNMMIMYRSFDRDEETPKTGKMETGRHKNKNGSYQYNLRFLIGGESPSNNGSIQNYLESLSNLSGNPTDYENGGKNHLLYRNIVKSDVSDVSDVSSLEIRGDEYDPQLLAALTQWMDVFFWDRLDAEGGVDECLDILRTPVGNNSRSFCDPALQTGLIHFNSLFEKSGGLDRVNITSVEDVSSAFIELSNKFEKGEISSLEYINLATTVSSDNNEPLLNKSLLIDLKRIVIFYYIFAGMASEIGMNSDNKKTYDPKNLTAILMPIKMRGAAWAVTIHATYMDVERRKRSFQYLPFWMSNFLLMTSQRQRFSFIFDRVLWENIEHRVSDLLVKYIGERDDADIDAALSIVNKYLRGEQRLLPYVFPQFKTNTSNSIHAESGQYVDLLPKTKQTENRTFQILWDTTTNPFYIPRQPWSGKPRRSFKQSVSLGVMYGLEQQALLIKRVQKKAQSYEQPKT